MPRGRKIMEERWMNISTEKPVHPELLWKESPCELTSHQALEFHPEVEPDPSGLMSSLWFSTHLREQKPQGSHLSPTGGFLCICLLPSLYWSSVTSCSNKSSFCSPSSCITGILIGTGDIKMKYNHPSVSTGYCSWIPEDAQGPYIKWLYAYSLHTSLSYTFK